MVEWGGLDVLESSPPLLEYWIPLCTSTVGAPHQD